MVRALRFSIIFSTSAIMLLGCSDSSDDPPKNTTTILEGSWAGECAVFTQGDFSGTSDWIEKYNGNNYQAFYSIYNTMDCTGGYQAQKEMLGSFVIGESSLTNNGVTAQDIDLTINQVSVDGQISGVDISQIGFDAGRIFYDIFHIVGRNLYYGDFNTGDGRTLENRPTEISFDLVYIQQ